MKKTDKLRLLLPSPEMKPRVMAFREAYLAAGEERIYGSCGLHHYDTFEAWMDNIRRQTVKVPGPNGTVAELPATTYFAIRKADNAIVGAANIRHYLNEACYHNGHIGYSVHPLERRKGYGKEILRLALIKSEELGIIEPVVSCNKSNRASKAVIEKNGLAFEREHTETDGGTVLVYRYPR
jgi:predicted acetyltransferase